MAMTREQLMTAAIQRLNEDPTASMGQLAEAVGVSRATLHRHFSSREELMVALGHRALDQWERAQDEAGITRPDDLAGALRALLLGLIDCADEYGFALTDYATAVHPDLQRRSDELEEREIAFYEAAQAAGLIRAGLPVRWVSNVVYGLLVGVRESLRRGDVARRDVPRLLLETFHRGTA
ncbi:MAG: TetR/AcrR family transcriptional regulator [Nonomuraea sp.]|nr:TetR/AcrR family transcriptional regulator [Nonomuraea sp.]